MSMYFSKENRIVVEFDGDKIVTPIYSKNSFVGGIMIINSATNVPIGEVVSDEVFNVENPDDVIDENILLMFKSDKSIDVVIKALERAKMAFQEKGE